MQNLNINVWTITFDVSYHSDNIFDSKVGFSGNCHFRSKLIFGKFSLFGREKKE